MRIRREVRNFAWHCWFSLQCCCKTFCFQPALCRMCVLIYCGLRVRGKNALLLYMTVCEKVVPWLDKYDDVIKWSFMKIPPPKWRAGCAPASRWSWILTSLHVFQVHYIAVCEKQELKNWYAFHLVKYVWRRFEVRVLKVACSLIALHARWLPWE